MVPLSSWWSVRRPAYWGVRPQCEATFTTRQAEPANDENETSSPSIDGIVRSWNVVMTETVAAAVAGSGRAADRSGPLVGSERRGGTASVRPVPVTSTEFLGLTDRPDGRSDMLLTPANTGGGASLFGGAGLAAGVVLAEQRTQRPAVWMTTQFVSLTRRGETISFGCAQPAVGRTMTQVHIDGEVDGRIVIAGLGACGERPEHHRTDQIRPPAAPGPEESEPVVRDPDDPSELHHLVETRVARGMFGFTETGAASGDERSWIWCRMPSVSLDGAVLALIADYMPSVLGNAVDSRVWCSSIDNTIRFADPVDDPDGWVLLENSAEFVGNGFGIGRCRMWSESGRLLATASQSMSVRLPPPDA